MQSFLHTVAEIIHKRHSDNLEQVTIILNNRRPIRFLKNELAKLYGDSFFLPQIIIVDDLISNLSNLKIIPNEFLLFELYTIHQELGVRKDEQFDEFMPTAEMILSDFSEIDLYAIDAEKIFNNLKDAKAIEQWNVSGEPMTQIQKDYLQFFESLYSYYQRLRENLKKTRQAYSGMAYREVAENIENLIETQSGQTTYFVGFQSLSRCEEIIIEAYLKRGIGHFISDGDCHYYTDDTEQKQEAGNFLRKYHKKYHNLIEEFDSNFRTKEKHIHIVSCPENVIQAKYAGNLLESFNNSKELENTALILADETLVVPVLNSIPKNVGQLNVTMGIPFIESNIYSLISKYFDLHTHLNKGKYHYQEVIQFVSGNILYNSLGNRAVHEEFRQRIQNNKIIYLTAEEVMNMAAESGLDLSSVAFAFDKVAPSPTEFVEGIGQLMQFIEERNVLANDEKEIQALTHLEEIVKHIATITERYPHIKSLGTLHKIFHRIAKRHSMAFIGEALEGLQLLGILEARNIDFERVIILSANEKIMPAGRSHNTLIPYSIKKMFQIPTHHEKDAVAAYRFYRMIQRANEVYLIYNADFEGSGKGEPSRFIKQICEELNYPNIHIYKEAVTLGMDTPPAAEQKPIEKNEFILSRVREIARKGFSASALNCYRSCPLKYYYEKVLHIQEEEQNEETLQSNEMGTLIHTVLEIIFKECINNTLTTVFIDNQIERVPSLIDKVFDDKVGKNRNRQGKNHLFLKAAQTQIVRFLEQEKERISSQPTEILACEQELSHEINLDGGKVRLYGIADRIDYRNGQVRIADYKTGSVEVSKELSVTDSNIDERDIPDKWFQVMLYAWMYSKNNNDSRPLVAGIYPLKTLGSDLAIAQWNGEEAITEQKLTVFEKYLTELLSDILNPDISFKASRKECKYCAFAAVCGEVDDGEQ